MKDKTKKKNTSFKEKQNLGELPKLRIIYKTRNP